MPLSHTWSQCIETLRNFKPIARIAHMTCKNSPNAWPCPLFPFLLRIRFKDCDSDKAGNKCWSQAGRSRILFWQDPAQIKPWLQWLRLGTAEFYGKGTMLAVLKPVAKFSCESEMLQLSVIISANWLARFRCHQAQHIYSKSHVLDRLPCFRWCRCQQCILQVHKACLGILVPKYMQEVSF